MPHADVQSSSRPRSCRTCAHARRRQPSARRSATAQIPEDATPSGVRERAAPRAGEAVRNADGPRKARKPALREGSTVAAPPSEAFAHADGPSSLHEVFRRMAHATAYLIGTPIAFFVAILAIVAWAISGPIFGYSDTWQLVINTGTTIVTFLVVFMIQNTQNRDSQAIHLKLDELIRAMKHARNQLVDVEDRSDAELARLRREMSTHCNDPDDCEGDDGDDGAARHRA